MSDTETAVTTAGAIAFLGHIIREGIAMLVRQFKRKNDSDDKRHEDAKRENERRDLWAKMETVETRLAAHEASDAANFAEVKTDLKYIRESQTEMGLNVKELLRRQQ